MRQIEIKPGNLRTTNVGYGCAQLMARVSLRESVRLLETAFDAGIRHFDVARSYGYGEAEKAVGEFVKGKRDQVTITTKFGIEPPRRSTALRAAKAIARRVVQIYPPLRQRLRKKAAQMNQTNRFDLTSARTSLETSLRELKVDSIDVLLLHECSLADLSDELFVFLETNAKTGKIKTFGLAATFADTSEILKSKPCFAPVVQIPHSVLNPNLARLPEPNDCAVFTHSILGADFLKIKDYLQTDQARAQKWSQALSLDAANQHNIAALMLDYAANTNPNGVVLYSSLNEQHIRDNAKMLAAADFSPEQRINFAELASEVRGQTS